MSLNLQINISRAVLVYAFIVGFQSLYCSKADAYPFQDANQPVETRVDDLISRLTLSEKVSLLHQWQPAISRLGIASFRTGTEALHGVAWLGTATVFPQAIGLSSTWDPNLIKRVGSVVGDEVRARHNQTGHYRGISVSVCYCLYGLQ
jgi:beta-glucosidase